MSQSLREGGFRTASAEASLPFFMQRMVFEKSRKPKNMDTLFFANGVQSCYKTQISK